MAKPLRATVLRDLVLLAAMLTALALCAVVVWRATSDYLVRPGTPNGPSRSEPARPSAPKIGPPAVAVDHTPAAIRWPSEVLPGPGTVAISLIHFGRLRLRFEGHTRPIRLSIAQGSVFESEASDTSPRVALEGLELTIPPRRSHTAELAVAIADPTRASGVGPGFAPPRAAVNRAEVAWLEASARLPWGLRQTGLWMLSHDIPAEQFAKIQVARSVAMAPELSSSGAVADGPGVLRVGQMLLALGHDPARFDLHQHHRGQLDRLLDEIQLNRPGKNLSSVLVNRALAPYIEIPGVATALLRHLVDNPDQNLRDVVFDQLLTAALPVPSDELYAVLADPAGDYRFQLLAATLLFRRDDPRGLPLLLAFEGAALAKAPLSGAATAIDRRRGAQPGQRSGESLWAYHERAIGWAAVPAEVLALARRLRDRPDPILAAAIEQAQRGELRRALEVLGGYPGSRPAFDAVARVALEGPVEFRPTAYGLLPRFTGAPLAEIYAQVLAAVPDDRLAGFAMSSLARARFDGKPGLLIGLLDHRLPGVRRAAIGQVAIAELPVAARVLARVRDPDVNVQVEAIAVLAKAGYEPLVPALVPLLDPLVATPLRWAATRALMRFRDHADAIAALTAHAEDATLGSAIRRHLEGAKR